MAFCKNSFTNSLVVLTSVSLAACGVERAGKSLLDDEFPSIHQTHVFIGKCVFAGDGQAAISGLAGKIVSSVISNGANAFGTALSEAAKEKESSDVVSQPFEIGTESFPECVQVVRGNFSLKILSVDQIDTLWAQQEKHFRDRSTDLFDRGIHLTQKPDFFLEAKFRASETVANAMTLYPVLAAYNTPIENVPLGSSTRRIKVKFSFHDAGNAATANGAATGVLDLGEMKIGQVADFGGIRIDYRGNSGASNSVSRTDSGANNTTTPANAQSQSNSSGSTPGPAQPVTVPLGGQTPAQPPKPKKTVGKVTTTAAPKNDAIVARTDKYLFESNWMSFPLSQRPELKTVTVKVDEVKDAEPGLAFAGTVFSDVKADLVAELENKLIEGKAKEAELAALKAQNDLTAAAAISYSEAFTKLTACSASGQVANAASAFAAQNKANLDALTAGQTPPFANDEIIKLSAKTSKNAAQCKDALAALEG